MFLLADQIYNYSEISRVFMTGIFIGVAIGGGTILFFLWPIKRQ